MWMRAIPVPPPTEKDVRRLFGKVSFQSDGCWQWNGATNYGYGVLAYRLNGRVVLLRVHRVVYTWMEGEIPEPLECDQLCRNRLCVNPAHIEIVTQLENTMRGYGVGAINARKTHCKRGHPLFGDNLRVRTKTKIGSRECRECGRIRQRGYRSHPRTALP